MDSLPEAIILLILAFLAVDDLASCFCTCRAWASWASMPFVQQRVGVPKTTLSAPQKHFSQLKTRVHYWLFSVLFISVAFTIKTKAFLLVLPSEYVDTKVRSEKVLFLAGKIGDKVLMENLEEGNINSTFASRPFQNPLIFAVEKKHLQLVTALIEAGADTNAKDTEGSTALTTAARNGALEIVHALLRSGAKVNIDDKPGWNPLYWASVQGHSDVVNALIDAGAKLDIQDDDGETALYGASSNGHLDVVTALINAGADVNLPDEEGKTPLDVIGTEFFAETCDVPEIEEALRAAGAIHG